MSFEKARFEVKGSELQFGMPFTKVDEERREVSGFATLDNVDSQNDVVLAEASIDAFARCRGNIREMHQPSAVGKLKAFEEKTFFGEDGTPYTGVYVTVHVSKGAEDAWQKVLDGTYSGFSIGGNITDTETQWVKDANSNVRFIKSYDLVELSLVDNPANQLANIFSIHKSAEGTTMVKGMIAESRKENVFWCASDHDGISDVTTSDSSTCPICKSKMVVVGQVNSDASQPVNEQVGEIIGKFLGSKGGTSETMTNEEITKSEEVVVNDETEVEEEPEGEESTVEVEAVEKPEAEEEVVQETVSEVDETPENDIEKVINDLKDIVKASAGESREIAEAASRKVEEEIAKINASLTDQLTEVNTKFEELSKTLEAVKEENNETRKSLEILSGNTAFKKSGEVDSPNEKSAKASPFAGVFLASTNDL